MVKPKSLIFIENEFHATEYLHKRKKFENIVPITFNFGAERKLSEAEIEFKTEEEYESPGLYKNIHESSLKETWKICKNINLKYRSVELLPLFYYNIYTILVSCKKYMRLFKEIIKKEKPQKITFFERDDKTQDETEFASKIIKQIFKEEVEKIIYFSKDTKKASSKDQILKIVRLIQKPITKLRLNLAKNKRKIFISGGKIYFDSLTKILMKDKRNKTFNFSTLFRKSFFIGLNYLPFYKFYGQKGLLKKKLSQEMNILYEEISQKNFFKEFDIAKEIDEIVKSRLINMVKKEVSHIVKLLDELYNAMKNKKIDMILLAAEDAPFIRGAVQLSKQFNIPTIVFLHGFSGISFPACFSNTDYLIIFGEGKKKNFLKEGFKEKQIKVLGSPRHDDFKIINTNSNIILYAMEVANGNDVVPDTHLTKKRQKEILKMVFKSMKNFPNYKLIIKTRPNWELAKLPLKIATEENFENFEIIEKTNNLKLLARSKIVIINQTTMGVEALLMGKPVISISYKDLDKFNAYKEIDFVDNVYSSDQLTESINKNLTNNKSLENEMEMLKEYLFTDRKSSKRATKFINKLLKNDKQ